MWQQEKSINSSPGSDSSRTSMLLRSACKYGCSADLELDYSPTRSVDSSHRHCPVHRHHTHHHNHQHHRDKYSFTSTTQLTKVREEESETIQEINASSAKDQLDSFDHDLVAKRYLFGRPKNLFVKLERLPVGVSHLSNNSDYSSGFDSDTEGKPKTDYTYARSRSYKSRVTPSKDGLNPNMSRNSLRGSCSPSDGSSDEEISYLLQCKSGTYSQLEQKYAKKEPQTSTPALFQSNLMMGHTASAMAYQQSNSHELITNTKKSIIINETSQTTVFHKMSSVITTSIIYPIWTCLSKMWFSIWQTVYRFVCRILLVDSWLISKLRKSWLSKILLLLAFILLVPLLLWLVGSSQSNFSSLQSTKIIGSISKMFDGWRTNKENWWHWFFLTHSDHQPKVQFDANIPAVMSTSDFKEIEDRFKKMLDAHSSQSVERYMEKVDLQIAALRKEKETLREQLNVFSLHSTDYNEKVQLLQDQIAALYAENEQLRLIVQSQKSASQQMRTDFAAMQFKLDQLQGQQSVLKNCCLNVTFHSRADEKPSEDQNFAGFLFEVLNSTHNEGSQMAAISALLRSQFADHQDLSELSVKIASIAKLEGRAAAIEVLKRESKARSSSASHDSNKATVSSENRYNMAVNHSAATCPTEDEIQKIANSIVRNALFMYDADKIGQFDYALESAGGSVISTRCAETYHTGTAQFSLFGIPFWYTANSPRTVIQPDIHPGQCWAFKGTQGYLVIQLSSTIKPTAFTLEHIPKSLSPNGRIDSAPKEFSVMGLRSETDLEGTLLGRYVYLDSDVSLQYFLVQEPEPGFYPIMELRIHSNHGNMDYTCLYRFRVHGSPH